MRTRFSELVGCAVPIQQAPMGAVSSPELAVAVADAGAVGTITALGVPAPALLQRLDEMRRRTDGALSVNFLLPDVDDETVAAAAQQVELVDFFWFDPDARLVEVAHSAGALVNWQVGSVDEARAAADSGCDVVTVQGVEAGGHVRGRRPLLPLLEQVLRRVGVPVLAAGGISDARAFAEVIAAGADGARVGTRFVATTESAAHPAYKQALVDAEGDCTVITDAFADCPLCATSATPRVLRSAVERVAEVGDVVAAATIGGRQIPVARGSGMPPVTGVEGRVDAMALYAGAGVGSVTSIRPAAEILADLVVQAGSPVSPAG